MLHVVELHCHHEHVCDDPCCMHGVVCVCLNTCVMHHAALAHLGHYVVIVQLLPVIAECDGIRFVCWICLSTKC